MPVIRQPDAVTEFDLESTVEIPVPDFSDTVTTNVADATVAMRMATNLDLSGATDVRRAPAEAGQIVRELGAAEERLARKADRIQVLELEMESAQAAEQQLRETMDREIAAVREAAQLDTQVTREEARRAMQQAQSDLLKASQDAAARASAVLSLEARVAEGAARGESLERDLAQLRADLDAERRAAAAARLQVAAQGADQGQLQRELAEVRAMNERQLEALRSAEGYRAVNAGLQYEAESQVAQLEQAARLASQALADRDRRIAALEQQLAHGGAAIVDQTTQLSQGVAERDALAARVAALEATLRDTETQHARMLSDEREVLSRLQSEKTAVEARLAERDQDYCRLEAQTRTNAETLANLHQTIQRLGREEPRPAPTATAVPLENMTRLLVREQDGLEEVHTLGRRTTVGRTPENDIMLDTGFISRHHAVLLASSRFTIVEDLNSTNGVRVNGRRVTRQVLHDGDIVTIGKTDFRYQLRPMTRPD